MSDSGEVCGVLRCTDAYDVTGKMEVFVVDVTGVQIGEDTETLVDLLRVSGQTVLGQCYHVSFTEGRREGGREGGRT